MSANSAHGPCGSVVVSADHALCDVTASCTLTIPRNNRGDSPPLNHVTIGTAKSNARRGQIYIEFFGALSNQLARSCSGASAVPNAGNPPIDIGTGRLGLACIKLRAPCIQQLPFHYHFARRQRLHDQQSNNHHQGPLNRRVAVTYSIARPVNPGQGIGTPVSDGAARAQTPVLARLSMVGRVARAFGLAVHRTVVPIVTRPATKGPHSLRTLQLWSAGAGHIRWSVR